MTLHSNTFDRYMDRDSTVHRLDPRVKVVCTLLFIVCVTILPDGAWVFYGIGLLLVALATLASDLSPWVVFKRSLIGLPFLLAAVSIVFTVPGNPLWAGPWGLTVSDAGLVRFASILLRTMISLQAAVLLTSTTTFPDILHALRHLKVPAILISIIAFMYRYLFVMTDEVSRLLRGRSSRSASVPGYKSGGTLRWRGAVAGHMVGQMLIRSLDRSDRVYNAMVARGYNGQMLTLRPHVMSNFDWAVLVVACTIAVALPIAAHLWGG